MLVQEERGPPDILTSMSATLLIVDDDPLVRRAVAERLAREGHTIVEAGSVREAHERLTSEIDLALLD
jgi:CheY-like chemotaxis protein